MFRNVMLASALTCVISMPANATRWVRIAETDAAVRYIDADAVVRTSDLVTIWLRTEYIHPGQRGEAAAVEKWTHDCTNRRAKVLALTLYKANGDVIASAELPHYRQDWEPIPPSSVGEDIHQRLCGSGAASDNLEKSPSDQGEIT